MLRRDLPPEAADRNLAWLRAKAGTPADAARTWGSLQRRPDPVIRRKPTPCFREHGARDQRRGATG